MVDSRTEDRERQLDFYEFFSTAPLAMSMRRFFITITV